MIVRIIHLPTSTHIYQTGRLLGKAPRISVHAAESYRPDYELRLSEKVEPNSFDTRISLNELRVLYRELSNFFSKEDDL